MTSSQSITPELRQWIIDQASAGITAPDLIEAMAKAGWTEDVAVKAVEQVLREHLRLDGSQPEATDLPPAVPVPEPDMADSPLCIDVGDRQVEVLMAMGNPRVVLFGNLLSPEECQALIDAAGTRMSRSLTVQTDGGGEEVHAHRTSDGMFFHRGENELVATLERRIARLVNWPIENGEGVQVLRYRVGAEYKPHYDYFDPQLPGSAGILKRGGQRVGTLVIYLNNTVKGGGTTFPEVPLEIGPRQGNAVFFSYSRAHPSSRTLHGGAPVTEGEKWIATKWLREREFI